MTLSKRDFLQVLAAASAAGLAYTLTPHATMGQRISGLRLNGQPLQAAASRQNFKVAGWAPVAEEASQQPGVRPVWEHVETWLRSQPGHVQARRINTPKLQGVQGDAGLAPS